MRRRRGAVLAAAIVVLAGCGSDNSGLDVTAVPSDAGSVTSTTVSTIPGEAPATVVGGGDGAGGGDGGGGTNTPTSRRTTKPAEPSNAG